MEVAAATRSTTVAPPSASSTIHAPQHLPEYEISGAPPLPTASALLGSHSAGLTLMPTRVGVGASPLTMPEASLASTETKGGELLNPMTRVTSSDILNVEAPLESDPYRLKYRSWRTGTAETGPFTATGSSDVADGGAEPSPPPAPGPLSLQPSTTMLEATSKLAALDKINPGGKPRLVPPPKGFGRSRSLGSLPTAESEPHVFVPAPLAGPLKQTSRDYDRVSEHSSHVEPSKELSSHSNKSSLVEEDGSEKKEDSRHGNENPFARLCRLTTDEFVKRVTSTTSPIREDVALSPVYGPNASAKVKSERLYAPMLERIREHLMGMPDWYVDATPAEEAAGHFLLLLEARRFCSPKGGGGVAVLVHPMATGRPQRGVSKISAARSAAADALKFIVVVCAKDQRQLLDAIIRCITTRASFLEGTIATTRDGFALDRFVMQTQSQEELNNLDFATLGHEIKQDIDLVLSSMKEPSSSAYSSNASSDQATNSKSTMAQQESKSPPRASNNAVDTAAVEEQHEPQPASKAIASTVVSASASSSNPQQVLILNAPMNAAIIKAAPWHVAFQEVRLIRLLGRGLSGNVFLGEWRGSRVAVKVLLRTSNTENREDSVHLAAPAAAPVSIKRSSSKSSSGHRMMGGTLPPLAHGSSTQKIASSASAALAAANYAAATSAALVSSHHSGTPSSTPSGSFSHPDEVDSQGGYSGAGVAAAASQASSNVETELLHELTIVSRLCHKNVVRFIGASARPPRYHIIFELCPGGAVSALVHQKPRRYSYMQVVLDAAQGLEYLHSQHVIHRDVKPDNLILDAYGTVKIADFGLSKFTEMSVTTDTSTHMRTVLRIPEHTSETGSYRYMAPEVMRHDPYSYPVDVYSFAMVAAALLIHKEPFESMTPLQAALGVARGGSRPTLPRKGPGAPDALLGLIQRAWHADPSKRPSFSNIVSELVALHRGLTKPERAILDVQ